MIQIEELMRHATFSERGPVSIAALGWRDSRGAFRVEIVGPNRPAVSNALRDYCRALAARLNREARKRAGI